MHFIIKASSSKNGKIMNNVLYYKTMQNLRNEIYDRLVGNENEYLKWSILKSKLRYMSQ